MSKQDSKKEPMIETNPNKGLWNTQLAATPSSLGISITDLAKVTFENTKTQTEEIKARIKSFETPINREALSRVFK